MNLRQYIMACFDRIFVQKSLFASSTRIIMAINTHSSLIIRNSYLSLYCLNNIVLRQDVHRATFIFCNHGRRGTRNITVYLT
jgi:hypothetical protein